MWGGYREGLRWQIHTGPMYVHASRALDKGDSQPPSLKSLHLSSELCVAALDSLKYTPPRYVRPGGGFVPNFQLFEKGDVNGEKEQKFYTFLKVRVGNMEEAPLSGLGLAHRNVLALV